MIVVLYAGASTADKDQDPETQLMHFRGYCIAQGCQFSQDDVDTASASDVAHRTAFLVLVALTAVEATDIIEFRLTNSRERKL